MKISCLLLLLFSCQVEVDPVSHIMLNAKSIHLVSNHPNIDPSQSDMITPYHRLLYQRLDQIAEISSQDSISWQVKWPSVRFKQSANSFVTTADIYFSFDRNRRQFNKIDPNFDKIFDSYQKISDNEVKFSFKQKYPFKDLSVLAFFVYSQDYTIDDLPIGTGSHIVMLKPDIDQYILIPYTEFLHLQTEPVEQVYWLNMNKEKLEKTQFKFETGDLNRYQDKEVQ